MWGKGNTPPLLVGVQTSAVTLEISMAISQKIRKQSTSRPTSIIVGYIFKGCPIMSQGHVVTYVYITALFVIAEPGNNLDDPQLNNG